MTLQIKWIDHHREPTEPPDPKFPIGVDLDVSEGATRTCSAPLPWPARRCGIYVVTCTDCGLAVGCSTAGRVDDPRSIKFACRVARQ